jgi:hypothetical protein
MTTLTDAEVKVAASLGLSEEGLRYMQQHVAARNSLSGAERDACDRMRLTPETFIERRDAPPLSDDELRAAQAGILRASQPVVLTDEERAHLLERADAIAAGEDDEAAPED